MRNAHVLTQCRSLIDLFPEMPHCFPLPSLLSYGANQVRKLPIGLSMLKLKYSAVISHFFLTRISRVKQLENRTIQ